MNYDIHATTNPLTKDDLYEGRTVCFSDVVSHPNNIGTLLRDNNNNIGAWKATINNTVYHFSVDGVCYENNSKQLYGIETDLNLDITQSSGITRGAGAQAVTTTLSSLSPKDQFAICALEALISTMPNAIAMDDATILSLAIKSYKISQAMLYIGTLARSADEAAAAATTDPVQVDKNNLTSDTDKILYNLCEAVKNNTKNQKEVGILIKTPTNTPIKTEISGTPTVQIQGTPTVNLASGTSVNVSNMPSEPIEVREQGTVTVTGTVDVGNFPEESNSSE